LKPIFFSYFFNFNFNKLARVAGDGVYIHKAPRQQDIAVPYRFPDMTRQKVAKRGV